MLVGHTGGCARLVGIRQSDNKGTVEQSYACRETEARPHGGFGAAFATQGQAVLFGCVDGCVLVWDRKKGAIVYGLEHEDGKSVFLRVMFLMRTSFTKGDLIQAVAVSSFHALEILKLICFMLEFRRTGFYEI